SRLNSAENVRRCLLIRHLSHGEDSRLNRCPGSVDHYTGERANTQALKLVPYLEVGLSHGDMRLGIRAARDDTAVVVSE
ncbi:hypothetical protein, partial [Pseudomonas aeruginosa]|uniref:hypothetical protein n=1 Tax=Pseudomonas aeruginosa TaxID=287 RepID=UPI002901D903